MANKTISGDGSGVISCTTDNALNSLEVDGASSQIEYAGYQLIPYPYTYDSRTINDVEFTVNSDGSITIEGTNSGSLINFYLTAVDALSFTGGTAYTFSCKNATTDAFLIVGSSASVIGYNTITSDTAVTKTASADGTSGNILIRVNAGATVDVTLYPMVEKGSTAHAFEPYTNGAPSPSPDFPQPITSVEEIHITIADGTGRKQEVEIDLDTPLRAVGDVHDVLELDGTITRNIGTIAEYDGETVSTDYMSTTGELSTGAFIEYVLTTPTTETLPAADIAALAALKTYFGHTNVTITDQDGNDISWVIGYKTYDTTGHPKLDYVNGGVI